MEGEHRSGCPINLTLEMLGDRWSLLIIRDLMFGNRRHYRELLAQSEEGISSNILAARLKMLMDEGMITKADNPAHKQKAVYSLTEKAIALVPILAQLGAWGRRYTPASEELSIRAELLEEGGPAMWERFMSELGEVHLGLPARRVGPSVAEQLQAGYEAVRARRARRQSKRRLPVRPPRETSGMARDEGLEELLREDLKAEPGLTEKAMFGGRAWLLGGNLLCGARDDGLLARLGKNRDGWALRTPGVIPMISRGRRMQGWVRAGPSAFGDDELRRKLLDAALAFVRALPAK
jgi:DNA-binding HxlR family transcriptional regulator